MLDKHIEVTEILDIIEEARKYGYPEHVLKHDLNTYIQNYENAIEHDCIEEIDYAVECAKEEIHEECYDDAFDEGKQEGIEESRYKVVETLINKLAELKNDIKEHNLTTKDIQIKLTELAIEMDRDDEFYTTIENVLKDFDK